MESITFHFPAKLVVGGEAFASFVEDIRSSGCKRIFVVGTPHTAEQMEQLTAATSEQGIRVLVDESIVDEPTFENFEEVLARARGFNTDCVVGVGGGSAMDVAKLIAAQIKNRQSTREVAGIGNLAERQTRMICLPTTSGTGSEMSPNALFTDADGQKVGVISPYLVPDAAYVCPELTASVPPAVTAATGIDAFTHCLEGFANRFAHPMTDMLALEGIRLIAESLERACRDGADLDARARVALGSVYGGMCLGPVNTGAVHALAYPLGTQFHIPHGLSNALLLAEVMTFNLPQATGRYAQVARVMGVADGAGEAETASNGIAHIRKLIEACGIDARLSAVGIPREAIPGLAEDAIKVQRLLKNNPRTVELEDAVAIYEAAF